MSRETEIVAEYQRRMATGEKGVVDSMATARGCSRPTIYLVLNRAGITREPKAERPPRAPRAPKAKRQLRDHQPGLARFVHYKAEPERTRALEFDHPAVVEGHTLFRSRVTPTRLSPRLLVSGANNPKTGGKVVKGQWAGMAIYTLTLEERATCPRSCSNWTSCYGNSMHWPRRNDARDPDFMGALAAEVVTVARLHPEGFVVRLHVLGDFFSVRYVLLWALLLEEVPNLHVFGYTGRRSDDPDPESARIGAAVEALRGRWSRFAVRTSHTAPGPRRAVVVDAPASGAGILTCPAQLEQTATCGSCGLCWSAPEKTIAFIRHGIKIRSAD